MSVDSENHPFDCPVCLIIFRRPDCTRRVLEALATVKPKRLFVVADGPRTDHPSDIPACTETRRLIEEIDWPCELTRNYSDVNMGCGRRPASGISWLFSQVEEAIIIEDDCVPDPSFFQFCAELLAKYRDDGRVMHISGCTYRRGDAPISESYYFSRAPACWGWATWRRAWQNYDNTVRRWPEFKDGAILMDCLQNERNAAEYAAALEQAYTQLGECSFWDYQWGFTCFINSGLSAYPRSNLVSNVGFGVDATHTHDPSSNEAALPTKPMRFPLAHPHAVEDNQVVASYYSKIKRRTSLKNKLWSFRPLYLVRKLAKNLVPQSLRSAMWRCAR